jgi:iron complex outermembrane receptor protein
MTYESVLSSGTEFTGIIQYVRRGEFQQRVSNNPLVDNIKAYNILNLTANYNFVGDTWGLDLMLLNATGVEGVNSSMTDVFGVAATGLEYIAPRQFMIRVSKQF